VSHALATYLAAGDFHSTAITHNAFIPDSLILTAVAFPIFSRAKNLLTEKAFLLWFQGAVIYGLWLLYFPFGPFSDLIRRG
jgi:hypothetical protein